MKKRLVVTFTGSGGVEIPLLYYGAKYYEEQGFEKLAISYVVKDISDYAAAYEHAKKAIQTITIAEYEEIVFLAKSIGTVICCKLKEELMIPAKLVLLTPIAETLSYMKKENDILLVVAGTEDTFLETERLQKHCRENGLPFYIEPGVGHRMEKKQDVQGTIDVIKKVIGLLGIHALQEKKTFTTLCYLEKEGNYLMLHRTKKVNDINKDKYIGVGGHIEHGESPEECIKREIWEETGLVAEELELRGLLTFVIDDVDEYSFLFTCSDFSGVYKTCDEGELVWIPKNQVGNLPIWEGDRIFFRLLEERKDFFSLKLQYEKDTLVDVMLDGKPHKR